MGSAATVTDRCNRLAPKQEAETSPVTKFGDGYSKELLLMKGDRKLEASLHINFPKQVIAATPVCY